MKIETVKGFKDFTGEEAFKREKIRGILVDIFQKYGFEPVDTPVVEYEEFVKGDNEGDEAVSDIFRLRDKGDRKLALRYEFTFQLKRLMENRKLPYKRYAIGPVFRDEPISGNRFRQFTQCDVDTVGATIRDEAEVLAIVNEVLTNLNINFNIYINNRKLLNEILKKENIEKMDWERVIKEIDKLDKLSEDEIYNNLRGYNAQNLLEIFKQPEEYFKKYENYLEIQKLKEYCEIYGIEVKFNPSLARGLSYYNGSVFEVKSKEMRETITAGGSFMFNGVQSTGLSFGLDRLMILANMNEVNNQYLILSLNQDKKAIQISRLLRKQGKDCILYYGKPSKALEYANSKKIKKVVFIGKEEVEKNEVKLKNMVSGEEKSISLDNLSEIK